jgi:hypothetical protein
MGFVVYDEDFRCDWFVGWECECALVNGFLLTVRYLLICAIRYELKDLQVIFSLDFHAVNAVPEYYLSDERHGACYASGDITLIVEHTFLLSRTQKIPEAITLRGKFCVPKIIRIAYAAT